MYGVISFFLCPSMASCFVIWSYIHRPLSHFEPKKNKTLLSLNCLIFLTDTLSIGGIIYDLVRLYPIWAILDYFCIIRVYCRNRSLYLLTFLLISSRFRFLDTIYLVTLALPSFAYQTRLNCCRKNFAKCVFTHKSLFGYS